MDDQGVLGSSQGISGSSQVADHNINEGANKPKSRAEYHKKRAATLKKENPIAHAANLARKYKGNINRKILEKFRAQQKKDIALKKEIAQNLDFDPNVFDSDVDFDVVSDVSAAQAADDTNFGSELDSNELDFEWDLNKDVSGSAQLASAADQPFGGKIKSFGLTIKRKHNNKKSIKRKRHKINKRLTIKHNNKKRRKTRKTK